VSTARFRQYDYGLVGNLLEYGHMSPPDYDLSKVTVPLAFYYSDNDWLADIKVSIHCHAAAFCYM
jgi:lysosomal acid lipase/cholesteryl ester hydrolase